MAAAPDDHLEAVAPLAQTLHRLDEAHRRFRGYVSRSLELSSGELAALVLIADTPGVTPEALSEDLTIAAGAIAVLLERLEDSGHVRTVPNPVDRRHHEVHLTEAGWQTLRQIQTAYRTVLGEADTDGALTEILPQLDSITSALNRAAHDRYPTL